MSTSLTRTNSLRKAVRPIYDIDEEDDDARRDSSGRKRVPVVECLLDTSADEVEDTNVDIEKTNHILWLTFDEICHIRYVLTRTNISLDKQYTQICRGDVCYRCRKKLTEFFLFTLFRCNTKRESCFICKQILCQKCLYPNFHPPALKLSIPIRIQTLLKPPVVTIDDDNNNNNNKKQKTKKTNIQTKTICYDCLQIFNVHIKTSENPISPLRRTFSLPPMSSKSSNDNRHVRHRRRPAPAPLEKIDSKTEDPNVTQF